MKGMSFETPRLEQILNSDLNKIVLYDVKQSHYQKLRTIVDIA